jgi:hypothetical protein
MRPSPSQSLTRVLGLWRWRRRRRRHLIGSSIHHRVHIRRRRIIAAHRRIHDVALLVRLHLLPPPSHTLWNTRSISVMRGRTGAENDVRWTVIRGLTVATIHYQPLNYDVRLFRKIRLTRSFDAID